MGWKSGSVGENSPRMVTSCACHLFCVIFSGDEELYTYTFCNFYELHYSSSIILKDDRSVLRTSTFNYLCSWGGWVES